MLPAPIAVQSFEVIAGRNSKIVELFGRVDGEKLCPRPALYLVRQRFNHVAGKQRGRSLVGEAPNHDF